MKTLIAALTAVFLFAGVDVPYMNTENTVNDKVLEYIEDNPYALVSTDFGVVSIEKSDIEMLAKLIWGEARGVNNKAEQAAVAWCVLNRVDAGFGPDIKSVITAPSQFTGYKSSNPVTEELYDLAYDVLLRWELEKMGIDDVGRTLPAGYFYFSGSGGRNYFRTGNKNSSYWDWSLPDPYV